MEAAGCSHSSPSQNRQEWKAGEAGMKTKYIDVGYGNFITAQRVVGAIAFNSSPARKLKKNASQAQKLVDATQGKRTKTLIITDTDHVWLCSLEREALLERLKETE